MGCSAVGKVVKGDVFFEVLTECFYYFNEFRL
jgi:hypothetical protein